MSIEDFKLSYQISPIILTNGSSDSVPGGSTPIVSLLSPSEFPDGLSGPGAVGSSLDDYFAHFEPLPGSTLSENEYGMYPFANQAVAANAGIAQPLRISFIMKCPVRDSVSYAQKQSVMTALKSSIDDHIGRGGTFTCATPSFIYTNCLLLSLKDVSDGDSKQTQTAYQWDFFKPLLTEEEAQAAQNSMMNKISSGAPVPGDPPSATGSQSSVGQPPTLAAGSTIPAASGAGGAGVAGPDAPTSMFFG